MADVATDDNMHVSVEGAEDTTCDVPSFELLSDGLMGQILPKMRLTEEKLIEIKKNQEVMIESLQNESDKVSGWDVNNEIATYMAEVKHYHAKLVKVRRDMITLSDRCRRMKNKAQDLQRQKEKEELKEQERRRSQIEKEKSLIAKPASKPPEKS